MKKGEDPRGCLRVDTIVCTYLGETLISGKGLPSAAPCCRRPLPPMRPRSMLFRLPDVAAGSGNDPEQSFGLPQRVMPILAFSERVPQIAWKIAYTDDSRVMSALG